MDSEENNNCSLLVIILDTNPSQRNLSSDPENLLTYIDSIMAFANAHLMQKANNSLAVLATHHNTTTFLFPRKEKLNLPNKQTDGQYEMFTTIERTVKHMLKELITKAPRITTPTESMLAGAMGKVTFDHYT